MTKANVITYADDATLFSSSTTVSELRVEVDRAVKWMETHKLVLKYVLLSAQLLFFRLLCRLTVVAVLSFGLMLHRRVSGNCRLCRGKQLELCCTLLFLPVCLG